MSASVTSLPNPSLSSISSLLLKSSKTEKYFVAESSNVIETSTSFSFGANGWPSSTPSDDGESDSPNQAIAVMFTTSGFFFSTTVLITVAGSSRSLCGISTTRNFPRFTERSCGFRPPSSDNLRTAITRHSCWNALAPSATLNQMNARYNDHAGDFQTDCLTFVSEPSSGLLGEPAERRRNPTGEESFLQASFDSSRRETAEYHRQEIQESRAVWGP